MGDSDVGGGYVAEEAQYLRREALQQAINMGQKGEPDRITLERAEKFLNFMLGGGDWAGVAK